jgi:hypothetical protein
VPSTSKIPTVHSSDSLQEIALRAQWKSTNIVRYFGAFIMNDQMWIVKVKINFIYRVL